MSEELKQIEQEQPCIDCEQISEELTAEEMALAEAQAREDAIVFLREVACMQPRQITNQIRIRVKGIAGEYGVELPKNLQCSSCWIDLSVRCYKEIKRRFPDPIVANDYKLREGVDVLWNGVRVNAQTMTDELAREWIAGGFPVQYFEKWK